MKTIETWFLWLMIYSIIGWVYESTICSIGHRKLINRGFLNGPYCPIYGTGAVLVLLVLGRIQNPVLLFFAGALVTCSLEYLTSWLTDAAFNWICAILFVGIVSDLVVTVKGLLGTHAVFAEYAVLLQQKRKELADRLRTGATEGCERILAATQEERAKLREAAAYGEEERERIRRDTEEERDRFYAKLQMRLNAQQRRTIYSFPHLTLTRNNEVLDGLRQNMEKVRQRAKKIS